MPYKRNPNDFADHAVSHRRTFSLADHEYLLSFTNDCGAAAFDEWWQIVGFEIYKEWCNDNLPRLEETYY